jgi:hypothetical protein
MDPRVVTAPRHGYVMIAAVAVVQQIALSPRRCHISDIRPWVKDRGEGMIARIRDKTTGKLVVELRNPAQARLRGLIRPAERLLPPNPRSSPADHPQGLLGESGTGRLQLRGGAFPEPALVNHCYGTFGL